MPLITQDGVLIEGDTLTFLKGAMLRLECFLVNVLPPITLEWIIDDETVHTEAFEGFDNTKMNFSLPLIVDSNVVRESIACATYGQFVQNTIRILSVAKGKNKSRLQN